MKSEPIIVIGAGVSGLTSATVLQILGYNTRIIAKNTYQSVDNKEEHPEFASLFPAASIIPHATYSEQLSALFKHSQSFFSTLYEKHFPGVDIHKHFEIFEEPREWPIYQKWMQGFKSIENADSAVPRPAYADPVFGWEFICLFVEWPRYFSALTDLYRKLGGAIKQHSLRAEDISNLPSQTIINCSGVGTASLFEDPGDEQRIMRGHLLHKEGAKPLTNHEGMSISYNYTPRSAIYSSANGKACDVYLYPRQDGWVIGGSREPGHLVNGEFEPSAIDQNLKHYHINSYAIPAPMVDLNRDILQHAYGIELGDAYTLKSNLGYRYIRNYNKEIRLSKEEIKNKKIIHNYGHGGAGVTLSWGCALEVAHLVVGKSTHELIDDIQNEFDHRHLTGLDF